MPISTATPTTAVFKVKVTWETLSWNGSDSGFIPASKGELCSLTETFCSSGSELACLQVSIPCDKKDFPVWHFDLPVFCLGVGSVRGCSRRAAAETKWKEQQTSWKLKQRLLSVSFSFQTRQQFGFSRVLCHESARLSAPELNLRAQSAAAASHRFHEFNSVFVSSQLRPPLLFFPAYCHLHPLIFLCPPLIAPHFAPVSSLTASPFYHASTAVFDERISQGLANEVPLLRH